MATNVACAARPPTSLGCAPASEPDLIGTWQITDGSREHLPEEFREAVGLRGPLAASSVVRSIR